MRVGFLTSDLNRAHGWGTYGLNLLQALRDQGLEMVVIASKNSPSFEGGMEAVLPTVAPRADYLVPRLALAVPQVRALLKSCDVIHVTAEPYALLGMWVAGDRPLFITGHGSYVQLPEQLRWPINALYRQAFRRAWMVCVSHYTARVAARTTGGLQTYVVNNGIEAARFAHLPPPNEPTAGPTVLSVGAVKARKGTLELVQAMAVVHQHIPDAQCIIVGKLNAEPTYTVRVRAEIDRLGLADCVKLLGIVPEEALLGWYGAADVFVLPSVNRDWKFEGYGLSLMEASAAGLPVIGTTDCGAEDAIDDGVTGLLLPQAQLAEALPQAIIHLLTDPAQAALMGQAGRAKAQEQTWGHVARQMIELYQKALDKPR